MIRPDMITTEQLSFDLEHELFGEDVSPLGNNATDGREDFEKYDEDAEDLYADWEKMLDYNAGIDEVLE